MPISRSSQLMCMLLQSSFPLGSPPSRAISSIRKYYHPRRWIMRRSKESGTLLEHRRDDAPVKCRWCFSLHAATPRTVFEQAMRPAFPFFLFLFLFVAFVLISWEQDSAGSKGARERCTLSISNVRNSRTWYFLLLLTYLLRNLNISHLGVRMFLYHRRGERKQAASTHEAPATKTFYVAFSFQWVR